MSREATRTSGVTRPPAVWASGGTRTSARSRPTPLTTGSRAARSALREERNISGAGGLTGAGATAPPGRSTGRGSARTRTTTTNCSPSWATVRGNQSVFRHHVGESGLLIETDSYCVASTLCDACTYLLFSSQPLWNHYNMFPFISNNSNGSVSFTFTSSILPLNLSL